MHEQLSRAAAHARHLRCAYFPAVGDFGCFSRVSYHKPWSFPFITPLRIKACEKLRGEQVPSRTRRIGGDEKFPFI